MPLYNRVCSLVIGSEGGKGKELTGLRIAFSIEKGSTKTPNKCSCRVWNLSESTRKQVEVIGNVLILKAGYAEDVGAVQIFAGTVIRSLTVREGPDWITELEMQDGFFQFRDSKASLSFAPGATTRQVLSGIAEKFGLPIRKLPDFTDKQYPAGFAFVGRARDAMDKVCELAGLEWSIQGMQIQILKKGGVYNKKKQKEVSKIDVEALKKQLEAVEAEIKAAGEYANSENKAIRALIDAGQYETAKPRNDALGVYIKNAQSTLYPKRDKLKKEIEDAEFSNNQKPNDGAFLLTHDTGMIGSPEQESQTMTEKAAAKLGFTKNQAGVRTIQELNREGKFETMLMVSGYKVRSLLQPTIEPGGYVKLKSKSINGEFFRVETLTHIGDTHSADWNTEMVLRYV